MLGQKQFILSLLALLPSVARPQLLSSEMEEEHLSRQAEGTSSSLRAATSGERSMSEATERPATRERGKIMFQRNVRK
jgi:hypothetical protein